MVTLNRQASELMQAVGVHACTDITGFGFLGHIVQLAKNSKVGLDIEAGTIPLFSEAIDFARQGLRPGGLFRNRDFYSNSVNFADGVPDYLNDILFDPQTSGGLLICVSPRKANKLLNALHKAEVTDARIIGEAVGEHKGVITVN
jgi:selenide,water dikinase